jgi:hypothetical protein
MESTPNKLIPLTTEALLAARPDWPYSGWATGHMIRTGRLGHVRIGKRVFVTPELLEQFIAKHTVQR